MVKDGASSVLCLLTAGLLLGGCSQQLIPSIGAPAGQQNKDCIDRNTGRRIPGCNTIEEIDPNRQPLRLTVPDNLRSAAELPGKPVSGAAASTTRAMPVIPRASDTFQARSGNSRGSFSIPADVNKPITNATPRPAQVARLAPPRPVNRSVQPVPVRPVSRPVQRPVYRPPAPRPVTQQPVQRPAAAPSRFATPAARPAPRRAGPAVTPATTSVPSVTARRLTLNGNTTFKVGSAKLSKSGKSELNGIAASLLSQGTKISQLKIEGHSDSTGSAAANQALSLRRANAVAEYLSTWGLPRSMMQTIGRGESTPVADNKTRKGRALNRRVEITAVGVRTTIR